MALRRWAVKGERWAVKGERRSGKKTENKIMLQGDMEHPHVCCGRSIPRRATKWTDKCCKCGVRKRPPPTTTRPRHTTGLRGSATLHIERAATEYALEFGVLAILGVLHWYFTGIKERRDGSTANQIL